MNVTEAVIIWGGGRGGGGMPLILQSHCMVGQSMRLRRTLVALVERILGGPGRLRILLPPPRCHSGRPGCSGADLGIIPGETSRKIQVLPGVLPASSGCSRTSSVRPGMGPVYSRGPWLWMHHGATPGPGVLFIFLGHGLYFYLIQYISNQIKFICTTINIVWQNGMHLHLLETYYYSHITNTRLYKIK